MVVQVQIPRDLILLELNDRKCVYALEVGLRVAELIDLLNLQIPFIVSCDGCDDQRFVGGIGPRCGLQLVGELQVGYQVKQMLSQTQRSRNQRE